MNTTRGPARWVQLKARDIHRTNTLPLTKAGSLALLLTLNATAQNETVSESPEVTGSEVVAVAWSPYMRPDSPESASGISLEPRFVTPFRTSDASLEPVLRTTRRPKSGFLWQEDEDTWIGAFETSLRHSGDSSSLGYVNVSPGFPTGFGAVDIGAGVNLLWLNSGWREFYPWVQTAPPDRAMQVDTEALGLGANVGLNVHITERQRIGLSYRRPVNIDYRGELQLYNGSPVLGGGMFRNEIRTSLKFPTIVAAGYGLSITDNLRLKADAEWLQYSKLKDLALMVANGIPGLPGSVNEIWQDTFALGVGGQYRLGDHWAVRAGYQFYKSPVQNSTDSATLANADQNLITLGIAFQHRNHAFEATYGANFDNGRGLLESFAAAPGQSDAGAMHLFSFTYRFLF